MYFLKLTILFIGLCIFNNCIIAQEIIQIPAAGNSFLTSSNSTTDSVSGEGITNWKSFSSEFSVYFRADTTCNALLGLDLQTFDKSTIQFILNNKQYALHLTGNAPKKVFINTPVMLHKGYVKIILKGLQKVGEQFAFIKNLLVKTNLPESRFHYVSENSGNRFYWGRRGPSVHLSYDVSAQQNITWFYNELTVPDGGDAVGSYFMADGFKEGYFGMQVNSSSERRVLFSVWSPFETDDPANIPDSERIIMLKKGTDVHVGEFGAEGSGGQSYLIFPWKAGNTYRFLLHTMPVENNYTYYTAYFFAPEKNEWKLIASFSRPKTTTYLTHLHSFLENFIDTNGYLTRFCSYNNQWVVDADNNWHQLLKATFTGDDIAKVKYRMDYKAGTHGNSFYLRNGGFFNDFVPLDKKFTKAATTSHPEINFKNLP